MTMDVVKRALIFGASGQDGAYLSHLLLTRGYEVHGASRDAEWQSFRRLDGRARRLSLGRLEEFVSLNFAKFVLSDAEQRAVANAH